VIHNLKDVKLQLSHMADAYVDVDLCDYHDNPVKEPVLCVDTSDGECGAVLICQKCVNEAFEFHAAKNKSS
jgi:hypothetical protein